MSYPPLSGYGAYHSPPPGSAARTTNVAGSNHTRSISGANNYPVHHPYEPNDRQGYQGFPGYNWPEQASQSFQIDQVPFSSGHGRHGSTTNNAYDYRGNAGYHNPPNMTAPPLQHPHHVNVPQAQEQNTQGLDNLAYASGLDITNARQHNPGDGRTNLSFLMHQSSHVAQHAQNRVNSPVQGSPRQRSNTSQPAHQSQGKVNTKAISPLATAAAAALAGAVSRRYPQASTVNNQSAVVSSISSGPLVASSLNHQSGPASVSPKPTHASNSWTTQQATNGAPPAPAGDQIGFSARTESVSVGRGDQAKHPPQNVRALSTRGPSNVSNLVANVHHETTQPTHQSSQSSQSSLKDQNMPNYIDPARVFNPYHKEHEIRRREAAQIEAEARRKESGVESVTREVQKPTSEPLDSREVDRSSERRETPSVSSEVGAKASPATEDEMAAELRNMMEKMKEYRSKDPALFQKLWEDMKKAGSAGSTAPSTSTRPASPKKPPPSNSSVLPPSSAASPPAPQSPSTTSRAPTPAAGQPKNQGAKVAHSPQGPSGAGQPSAGGRTQRKVGSWRVEPGAHSQAFQGQIPGPATMQNPTTASTRNAPAKTSTALTVLKTVPAPQLAATSHVGSMPPFTPMPPNSAQRLRASVVWPEEKRSALAAAAVKALKTVPANEKSLLTDSEVLNMLARNPSYIELCEMLERRGLQFNRGLFARQLLNSIPDLAAPPKEGRSPDLIHPVFTHPPPPPNAKMNMSSGPPPPSFPVAPNCGRPLQVQTATYASQPQVPAISLNFKPNVSHQAGPRTGNKVVPGKPKTLVPPRPEPAPGSKEAMAKKRDFSEIVDLTQLSDTDDYVMSRKSARVHSPSPEVDILRSFQVAEDGSLLGANLGHGAPSVTTTKGFTNGPPLRFDPTKPQQAPGVTQPPQPHAKVILAKPLNKGEALRKSYYDPRTVARDILIAAGRHPTERSLNAHLASLLSAHVELNSDLSTFDWEAIDPGGPPMPRVESVDVPAAPPRFKLGRRMEKHKREAEKEPRPPNTVRSADHSAPAPAPAPTLSSSLARLSTQTQQIYHDSLKSRPPPPSSRLQQTYPAKEPPHLLAHGPTVGKKPSLTIAESSPKSTQTSPQPSVRSTDSHKMENTNSSGARRRGRPVGSKNKNPSAAAVRKLTKPAPQIEVDIPAPASNAQPLFRCKWVKCHANLHNITTLRAHVTKVHEPSKDVVEEHNYSCWWKGCKFLVRAEDGSVTVAKPFTNRKDWLQHVEEEHIFPVALRPPFKDHARTHSHLDPQSLARDKNRYLSDPNGKITTPSISMKSNRDLPADALVLTKVSNDEVDLAAQKSFLKAHRNERANPKTVAEETLRAMEARKAKIGAGIDRGGCTLVNEARRETLIQNQGLRREVDLDY